MTGALRPLRPHQERALESLRASLTCGHRRPMLQAPTRFGKTLTAAHIIQRALDKGKRVAFIVPALSLIDQTVAALEAEGMSRQDDARGEEIIPGWLRRPIRQGGSRIRRPAQYPQFDRQLLPPRAKELESFLHVEGIMDRARAAPGNSTTAPQLVELGLAHEGARCTAPCVAPVRWADTSASAWSSTSLNC
jgi:hypothetical protein